MRPHKEAALYTALRSVRPTVRAWNSRMEHQRKFKCSIVSRWQQQLVASFWCVRLSRLLVGFRTHFKSLHFQSLHFHHEVEGQSGQLGISNARQHVCMLFGLISECHISSTCCTDYRWSSLHNFEISILLFLSCTVSKLRLIMSNFG